MHRGDLANVLAEAETHYHGRHPNSARRHAGATAHLPGGNTRTVLHFNPFPLTFASGCGNRLTDIDGLGYLDLLGEYSAGLYGHSNPIIHAAMQHALNDGLLLGGPTYTKRSWRQQSARASRRSISCDSQTPAPRRT